MLGAKPAGATEKFCIFYLKKVIFSAFNYIICCSLTMSYVHRRRSGGGRRLLESNTEGGDICLAPMVFGTCVKKLNACAVAKTVPKGSY